MAQFTDDAVETIEQDILPGLNFVAVTGFNTADGLRLDQRGDAGYYEHYLAKKGCTIQVYKRVLEINTGGVRMDRHKTVGTISIKNSEKVLMSAHSGYTSRPERENLCLDTQKWNSLALHNLAKQLNFKFPKSQRDNARFTVQDEHRGRAHAGHVEVLLACWFVVEMTRRSFNLVNEPAERVITQIKRLKTVDLGDYRTAFITIDSEPCRTCLDFLNRISQYTRIGFTIFGSHGIGPIQVRVDGRRREDIVGDTMPDSSYDEASEGGEDGEGGGGGGGGTGQPDTFTQKELTPAAPTTPAPRSVRRPGRWRTGQWSPENPEQLLNSYKKGTPVYEFPGYQPAIQPSRHERSAQPNIVQDQQQHTDIGDHWEHIGREETDIQNDWVDLGDGLMIQQHGSPNVHQDDQTLFKPRMQCRPSSDDQDDEPRLPEIPPAHIGIMAITITITIAVAATIAITLIMSRLSSPTCHSEACSRYDDTSKNSATGKEIKSMSPF
ncbi:hypothetical protein F4777DRAFT_581420 [Nemania sp. FL0916]|nr:hypothetical protein F4777DRAFT_581420 [Nemania sp. FL0916]